jgi:hypothetical protein
MPTTLIGDYGTREPLEAVRADLAVIVPGTVKSGHIVARKDVLGVIAASKLLRRRTRTLAAGTGFAVDSPVGRVEDASLFVAGDVLKDANGAVIGTMLSVDTTTAPDTVTLTGNAAVAVAAGAAVLGSDGSQVAQAIADQGSDGVGDATIATYIGGFLNETGLRGLDASAKAELGGVSTVGGIFKF